LTEQLKNTLFLCEGKNMHDMPPQEVVLKDLQTAKKLHTEQRLPRPGNPDTSRQPLSDTVRSALQFRCYVQNKSDPKRAEVQLAEASLYADLNHWQEAAILSRDVAALRLPVELSLNAAFLSVTALAQMRQNEACTKLYQSDLRETLQRYCSPPVADGRCDNLKRRQEVDSGK
jgi:hypothetical protein